jgi:hypothetical protein
LHPLLLADLPGALAFIRGPDASRPALPSGIEWQSASAWLLKK